MLEISKALSFMLTILSIFPVLMAAFFEPNTDWQTRMASAALRLMMAACIAAMSGLIFTWPSKDNPDARQHLLQTLPVRFFLWAAGLLSVLFFVAWYTRCGGQTSFHWRSDC